MLCVFHLAEREEEEEEAVGAGFDSLCHPTQMARNQEPAKSSPDTPQCSSLACLTPKCPCAQICKRKETAGTAWVPGAAHPEQEVAS